MEELKDKKFIAKFAEVEPKLQQLYIEGSLPAGPYLTVVGPRKPSIYAVRVINQFISRVAPYCTIVSGLAYGVDVLALQTAVNGGGKILSICPTGVKNIQPPAHQNFITYVLNNEKGAVVSEYISVGSVYKSLFLLRNRLLAAVGDVVFAPEASFKSGTHNTLKHALDLNRVIATVPAEIYSQTHELTNKLISIGAQVVLHPDDLLSLMNIQVKTKKGDSKYAPLVAVIKGGEFEPSVILDKLNISVGDFASLIIEAEAERIIQRDQDGRIMLV